jgi:hypothetical protein
MSSTRKVHRIYVDVLATAEQLQALQDVIGEALCAAPGDHVGPCRIAWSLSFSSEDPDGDQDGSGLSRENVADIREHLAPIEVWQADDVDRSLGITPTPHRPLSPAP